MKLKAIVYTGAFVDSNTTVAEVQSMAIVGKVRSMLTIEDKLMSRECGQDGSDSLTGDEFSEGLEELGFFGKAATPPASVMLSVAQTVSKERTKYRS